MKPRIVMMGTGMFARPTFDALLAEPEIVVVGLVTQPDRDVGNARGSTRQVGATLKDRAIARNIAVYQPESINTGEGIAQLRAWQTDLLVVAAYGQILKKEILEAATWGGINVHGSLLPKYRGAAPVAWAIYHGETHTGVTIIRMTTGLDAGDMLAQDSLDILPDETSGELESRLAPLGARLAIDIVRRLIAGTVLGTKQDQALVTKAPKLKKENGLIDWNRSAEQVCRQIRAMQPWPTAYTFLHREGHEPLRLTVQRGTPATMAAPAAPGHVIAEAARLLVAVDGGAVEVLELQPAGKRRMASADFLRGHALRAGDRFGAGTSGVA